MTATTEPDIGSPERDAAYDFLKRAGLEPTPDAIEQLSGPFLYALEVMCTRGYDPHGRTWRQKGWRGQVHDILNKAGRLKYHSWFHRDFDPDSAIDMINFCGYYYRLRNEGLPWGEMGEPG
jgi:hypothetical protein